jgi:hypothetical protein
MDRQEADGLQHGSETESLFEVAETSIDDFFDYAACRTGVHGIG